MQDPKEEGSRVDELIAFAASEGHGSDPAALLNYFHHLEKSSDLGGSRSSLDRAWYSMKTLQARRALRALSDA